VVEKIKGIVSRDLHICFWYRSIDLKLLPLTERVHFVFLSNFLIFVSRRSESTLWLDLAFSHRWKWLQMGKGIVVFILVLFLSALLRLESKLIVAACEYVTYELGKRYELGKLRYKLGKLRYELGKFPQITLASLHAATISLDSSLKRAERNKTKMMTTIPLPICNLFHLCIQPNQRIKGKIFFYCFSKGN
jgi:hypothetical protein